MSLGAGIPGMATGTITARSLRGSAAMISASNSWRSAARTQQPGRAPHDVVGRQDLSLGRRRPRPSRSRTRSWSASSTVAEETAAAARVGSKPSCGRGLAAHGQGLLRVLALVRGGWPPPMARPWRWHRPPRSPAPRRCRSARAAEAVARPGAGGSTQSSGQASQREEQGHQCILVARARSHSSHHFRFPSPGQPEIPWPPELTAPPCRLASACWLLTGLEFRPIVNDHGATGRRQVRATAVTLEVLPGP